MNIDRATIGYPGNATTGGIFRDCSGGFVGAFSLHLRVDVAYHVEIRAVIKAIEIANEQN